MSPATPAKQWNQANVGARPPSRAVVLTAAGLGAILLWAILLWAVLLRTILL
jgi:hypothetical protein